MANRIIVVLQQNEFSALLTMAIDDLRNPADELRHILRLEIERRKKRLSTAETQEKHQQFQEIHYE